MFPSFLNPHTLFLNRDQFRERQESFHVHSYIANFTSIILYAQSIKTLHILSHNRSIPYVAYATQIILKQRNSQCILNSIKKPEKKATGFSSETNRLTLSVFHTPFIMEM